MTRDTRAARLLLLLGSTLAWALGAPLALAHSPHDTLEVVAISPAFADDGTALAHARLTDRGVFVLTHDRGRSFTILGARPAMGDVRDLAFSPEFARDQTVFCATFDVGLWRSTNGGLAWSRLDQGLPTASISEVAVSPRFEVDRTVLAATAAGLFRSTDGGDTWVALTNGLTESAVTVVGYVPGQPWRIFTGRLTLHVSNNAGTSFSALAPMPMPLESLAVSQTYSLDQTVVVSFGRFGQGLQRSVNGGVSFQLLNTGLNDLRVNDVEIAPDGTLFCATFGGGCHRLLPGETSWSYQAQGWEPLSIQTNDHAQDVALSPEFDSDGFLLVGAFEGLFRSDDGGDTWTQGDVYNQRLFRQVIVSPDYLTDRSVFFGNYGGGPFLWREVGGVAPAGGTAGPTRAGPQVVSGSALSGSPKAAAGPLAEAPSPGFLAPGWTHLGRDVGSLWSASLTVSPSFASDRTLWSAHAGMFRSTDGGKSFQLQSSPVIVARAIVPVPDFPADPTLFLGSSSQGSFRSDDGGSSWTPLGGGLSAGIQTSSVVLAPGFPSDSRIFWGTQSTGVYRSLDGGGTFAQIMPLPLGSHVRQLALSPSFAIDQVLFLASTRDGLLRSSDGGDSFVQVTAGLPSGNDNSVESVALSPGFISDGTVFLASLYDGVFRSQDGGLTWTSASAGLEGVAPRMLSLSPGFANDRTLYLASYNWAWRSTDAGQSWTRLPYDLRVNDTHPTAGGDTLLGSPWSTVSAAGNYGLGVTQSNLLDASLPFSFQGRSVVWQAQKDASSGLADVFIDGQLHGRFDLYAPSTQQGVAIFGKTWPQSGWHELEIRVVGASTPASSGTWVRTDGFRVRE